MGENRDKQKEEDLLEMHARLASMKKEITGSFLDLTELQHGVLDVKPELKLKDEDESSHLGSGEYVKYAR